MHIDLIIFDFDGTLADSIPPAIDAIQKMISNLGYPYRTKEEINQYVGFGEIPLVSGAIGTKDHGKVKSAMEMYFKHYMDDGLEKITLYPHVRETLEFLKDKKKLILSNKRDELIKKILKHHNLSKYFIEVLGGDSAPCLKPDPCVVNRIIKDYNITPDRTLFVGDMTVDVETGKNAGVHTCAVTYGFHDHCKLASLKPDFIIDDILKLTEIVE